MPRTTANAVKGIIEVDDDQDLTSYIETANALVTDQCTGYRSDGVTPQYDSTRLELIERWLSAHFFAINFRRTLQEGVATGPNQMFDRIQVDLGLNNTAYGQQAMRLDTFGNLAALENSMKTVKKTFNGEGRRIVWLGSDC